MSDAALTPVAGLGFCRAARPGRGPQTEIRRKARLGFTDPGFTRPVKTDRVISVGAQSMLIGWPDAPVLRRTLKAFLASLVGQLWRGGRKDVQIGNGVFPFAWLTTWN